MMRSEYTPGPWSHSGADDFGDYNIVHPADALAVAAVISNMRPPIEVLANARLIAAAPDMYEVLKALLEPPLSLRWSAGKLGRALEAARVALAKAEGRE
jgi:hypothetical protein